MLDGCYKFDKNCTTNKISPYKKNIVISLMIILSDKFRNSATRIPLHRMRSSLNDATPRNA